MRSILVVEDEPLLRERIASVLRANGYRVLEAENGKVAIEMLQANEGLSLVLLDMVMPQLDGWGFLDFQRNNPKFANIPVIAISAFENMARSAKPAGYLPKPVETEELLRAVAEFT